MVSGYIIPIIIIFVVVMTTMMVQANGERDDRIRCNSLVSRSRDHAQLDALQPHS